MTGWAALDRLLDTDPRDRGCDLARELMDVYAELLLSDRAGAQGRYADVAAHLHACGPCAEDFDGLLAVLRRW